MATSAKSDKSKNAERDEIDELQKMVVGLLAETRDLYYNKIAGVEREIENMKVEIESTDKDTSRLNELCAKLDVETKFSYEMFTANRKEMENMQKNHPRLIAALHKFEIELKEMYCDVEKTRAYWKEFCHQQDFVYAKHEKTYAKIGWASQYKKLYNENQHLLERKIETERRVEDLETKIKEAEKEIHALSHDELPWNKVCVQFSEIMLKNNQMKKDIRTVEIDIARLTAIKKKMSKPSFSPKNILKKPLVESVKFQNANEKPAVLEDVGQVNVGNENAINPEKITEKPVQNLIKFQNMGEISSDVTNDVMQVKTPKPFVTSVKFQNVDEVSSASTDDVIRVNIDKESVNSASTPNDENAMYVDEDQTHSFGKQNAFDATYSFDAASPAVMNNSDQGFEFLNSMFAVGGSSNFNGNGIFNVLNNGDPDKTPESSNDGGGFFRMFGNFGGINVGGGRSPSSEGGNGGRFPFNFGGGSDKDDEVAGGGFFRF